MDSNKYVLILDSEMRPSARKLFGRREFIFQRLSIARLATETFEDHGINVLDCLLIHPI
jgi:hypothetical protein